MCMALDAKMDVDEQCPVPASKTFRQYRDLDEEDPLEVEASKYNLNYIQSGGSAGNVGNMVNGAGLAMATMDMHQVWPAPNRSNFLDVGGGASAEADGGKRV